MPEGPGKTGIPGLPLSSSALRRQASAPAAQDRTTPDTIHSCRALLHSFSCQRKKAADATSRRYFFAVLCFVFVEDVFCEDVFLTAVFFAEEVFFEELTDDFLLDEVLRTEDFFVFEEVFVALLLELERLDFESA